MTAVLPGLCLLLWGWFALSNSSAGFSSDDQERFYLWLPLAMAGWSLALLLVRNTKYLKVAVQLLALLSFLGLLPYLFFYTGGM